MEKQSFASNIHTNLKELFLDQITAQNVLG